MAGDWIPVRTGLKREPEVLRLAEETGRSVHEVMGLLVDFWSWVSDVSADGRIESGSMRTLCATVGGDDELWHALERVGWLDLGGGICVPHFERYLGGGAKRRLKDASRKRLARARRVRKTSATCPRRRGHDADQRREEEMTGHLHKKEDDGCADLSDGRRGGEPGVACGSVAEPRALGSMDPEATKEGVPPHPGPRSPPGVGAAASGVESPETSAVVPEALGDLTLYRDDRTLCGRWEALLSAWRKAYPAVDILAEVRKAHAWEVANPRCQKRDRARFLGRWLSRAQDAAGARGLASAVPWGVVNPLGRRSSFAKEGKFSDARFR